MPHSGRSYQVPCESETGLSSQEHPASEDDLSRINLSDGRHHFAVGSALFGVFVTIDDHAAWVRDNHGTFGSRESASA